MYRRFYNLNNAIASAERFRIILKNHKATFNCTSLHPFAKGKNQILSNHPRYKRIMEDLQIVGRRFITQGLHVHIGIDDCENVSSNCGRWLGTHNQVV